jgi:hypothetical protein
MKDEGAPPAQEESAQRETGPYTNRPSRVVVVMPRAGRKRSRGARAALEEGTLGVVVGVVLVMLLLLLWRTTEVTRLPPDRSHKTTAEWAARVGRERLEGVGTEQRFLEERIHRLIERVPPTVWQRTVIRAQLLYEARRGVPRHPEEVGDT